MDEKETESEVESKPVIAEPMTTAETVVAATVVVILMFPFLAGVLAWSPELYAWQIARFIRENILWMCLAIYGAAMVLIVLHIVRARRAGTRPGVNALTSESAGD